MITNKEIETATTKIIPKVFYNELPQDYRGSFLRTVKVKEVGNKVKVFRFSDYVTTQTITLEYFDYGIKGTVRTEKNYRAPEQYTVYFYPDGSLIKNDLEGLTRRQKWNKLKK